MNAPLRRVTIVVIVLFSLLFLNLNWVQFAEHDFYQNNAYNDRVTIAEYSRQRGSIVAGSETLADSVPTEDGDEYKYRRQYPLNEPFAHLTGYQSLVYGDSGLEQTENQILSGEDPRLFVDRLSELFTGTEVAGGNVVLSIEPEIQLAAWEAITGVSEGQVGAAVVLDPRSGRVLAQVSAPSYDPNPLASHDNQESSEAWTAYTSDPSNPMLDRSTRELYPPGSTMKVVVAAAALAAGMTPETEISSGNSYTPPNAGTTITNSENQCPEDELTLQEALTRSCNTSFAKLCVEELGPEPIAEMAEALGFGQQLTTPLGVEASQWGDLSDPAFLAQACIGQHEVKLTVMQDAMLSAAVANGGSLMSPQLIREIQAPNQTTLEFGPEDELSNPFSADVAADLRKMMENVVSASNGTGANARIEGFTVGGKTGTAQHGVDENGNDLPEHGWFTGYAFNGDGEPVVAVSVFLAAAGDGGSGEATRIAGELMRLALE
ncbi:peptidoglycan glycosyltransferase [Stackebrandtia albiflava]|uniref:Peptidoglycan glycosyltransferase n=1 Tax=Stackebrandtia albiflava TaxID=406432 RepID=A0A562V150_9ACTN|nr:penicillin-binding transpeptidase domain-containing protein [Stackebrandtia albiflava]TWJ11527.1 peptidoglycan glycosyltransferase [Stackebrandtia albiflava]